MRVRRPGGAAWAQGCPGQKGRLVAGGGRFFRHAALCGPGVLHLCPSQAYKTVFFPNTRINGVDVSDRTLEEVKSAFSAATDRYRLSVLTGAGETETIDGGAIGLHTVFDGKLEQILADQNPYRWVLHLREAGTTRLRPWWPGTRRR